MASVAETPHSVIIELLEKILSRPGMSRELAATEARIPAENGGQAISDVLRRRHRIYVSLVDWTLENSLLAGDPIERAMTHLATAGLDAGEQENIRKLITSLLSRKPIGTTITADDKGFKAYGSPKAVGEDPAPYAESVEAKPRPINRRDELKIFHVTNKASHDAIPIPKWLNLAAGPGGELELCEDYLYFRELRDWKGVHSAVIRGDSMLDTLRHEDLVLMREFETGKYELPHIESKAEKVTLKDWQRESKIYHDDICVLSINDEAPTLKRVKYDTRRGALNWKMRINADNPAAWGEPWQVETVDRIVFYAKLVGIGEGKYTKR